MRAKVADRWPLVSVIVPAYQAERFIEETLDSAAHQDYPAVEVIVVDDGSTDRTAELVAGRGVRLLRQPHRGPAAARNTGVAAAAGEFIAVLDADDLWPSDRLSRQVDFLQRNPEVGLVLGLTDVFLNPGEDPPPHWAGLTNGEPIAAVAGTMLAASRGVRDRRQLRRIAVEMRGHRMARPREGRRDRRRSARPGRSALPDPRRQHLTRH